MKLTPVLLLASAANRLPFRIGRVTDKTPTSKWATETDLLSWLILVNSQGRVTAEGFSVEELADKLHEIGR